VDLVGLEDAADGVVAVVGQLAVRLVIPQEGEGEFEQRQVAGLLPDIVEQAVDKARLEVCSLPFGRPLLYEAWTRVNWPKVEAVTGPVDVAHATGLVPCATDVPLVVTVHDLAFRHDPAKFSRQGVRIMNRSLAVIAERAARVICSSRSTLQDCVDAGLDEERLRVVPLGVDVRPVRDGDVRRVMRTYRLPDEFVLFLGTVEPRTEQRA